MPCGITRKSRFSPDGPLDIRRGHLAFFRQSVDQDGDIFPVKAIEYPILDTPVACSELMDSVAEVIGFWAAELMAHRRQALDTGDTFRLGAPLSLVQRAEPLEHWHLPIIVLVEDHISLGHPLALQK